MRKSILSLIMALSMVAVSPVGAQVKFGVKGGVNLNKMSMDKDVFKTTNHVGFFIGPTVKIGLPAPGLGMDLSALYNRQEAKIEGVNNKFNTVLKQQQVIVPANVKYIIGVGSAANFFVYTGPQIAFNIGDKLEDLPDDVGEWSLESSSFSVNAGLGLTLATHFQLTANYNIGVGKTGDITLKGIKESVENHKTKANCWRIGLTYFF